MPTKHQGKGVKVSQPNSLQIELKRSYLNPTHFLMSQKFYNSTWTTTGW